MFFTRFASDNVVFKKVYQIEENGVMITKVFNEVIVVFVADIYSVLTGYVPYPLIDVFSSFGTRSIQVNERFAMRVEAL